MYYETEGMSYLRHTLTQAGHKDEDINKFKECLITLEKRGLCLSLRTGVEGVDDFFKP
jgi:hypothetical protein